MLPRCCQTVDAAFGTGDDGCMPPAYLVSAADVLYLLCSLLLLGSALVVVARAPKSPLHRRYALTAVSLLGWVATLGLFYRASSPALVQALGRANFACAALAVTFGYLLVRSLADEDGRKRLARRNQGGTPVVTMLTAEAVLLAAVSAFTGLVDRAELVHSGIDGRHLTVYGPLFPVYAAHIVGYLGASALVAFHARNGEARGAMRDRLTLVGLGVLATGLVGVFSDILLPYGFGDFRFVDAGPLSTALFLLAVGYAVLKHRLFDLRRLVRKTVVLGLLGSLALGIYGAVVLLATERFAGSGSDTLTRFSVLAIALSFNPLQRALEAKVDRLLAKR